MIEIEKKYDVTDSDLNKIREKCELISSKTILDKYFDTDNFLLFSNDIKLRKRNDVFELKIKISNKDSKYIKSLEITNIEEIKDKLVILGTSFQDLEQVLEISTKVDKFKFNFDWYDFIIDVQKYKYGYRYEIELELEEDLDWELDPEQLINSFRKYLWLNSPEQLINWSKILICAENENVELSNVIKEIEWLISKI